MRCQGTPWPWSDDDRDPIQTHHVYPPIPIRDYDWCAYRDPESRMVGWGRTEADAVLDFTRLELEADCERECWRNGVEQCQFASSGKCPLTDTELDKGTN